MRKEINHSPSNTKHLNQKSASYPINNSQILKLMRLKKLRIIEELEIEE